MTRPNQPPAMAPTDLLTVTAMAEKLGDITPNRLRQKLKDEGVTFYTFWREHRVSEADVWACVVRSSKITEPK